MPKGQQIKGTGVVIKADVPLSELFGYVTSLRTITSGRGAATLTFSHYSEVPSNIANDVVRAMKGATA
jgi:elongation factor G